MKNVEPSGVTLLTAGDRESAPLSASKGGTLAEKMRPHLLERILYHGFVGLFLATILVLFAVSTHLFPSSHQGTILFGIWMVLAGSYTYWRVKRELMPKKGSDFPKGWGPFLREVPNFLLRGCMLGMAISLIFERFAVAFVVCGGILTVGLFAWLHSARLREIEKSIEKNDQEIEKWASDGDEEERSRRRAYVQSGALLIGAAAAGVAEYEGAPKLVWPATPSYASYDCCDDDDESMGSVNPATGLPMCGSIDVGGNAWGCSGDD